MSRLRNPFAIKNNKVIMISDLTEAQRGLSCACFCPSCQAPFIARMGDIKVHHFAHSTEGCDEAQAYIAGLYRLFKEMIDGGCPIYLPPVIVQYQLDEKERLTEKTVSAKCWLKSVFYDTDNQIQVSAGKTFVFENASFAYSSKNRIQALILTLHGKRLAMRLTPPDSVCKTANVTAYKAMPTLEIDFRKDEEKIQQSSRKAMERYISSRNLPCRWIYNPIISKAYPEIIRRSDEYCNKAEEARRIREEQEKWILEKRKEERLVRPSLGRLH